MTAKSSVLRPFKRLIVRLAPKIILPDDWRQKHVYFDVHGGIWLAAHSKEVKSFWSIRTSSARVGSQNRVKFYSSRNEDAHEKRNGEQNGCDLCKQFKRAGWRCEQKCRTADHQAKEGCEECPSHSALKISSVAWLMMGLQVVDCWLSVREFGDWRSSLWCLV